jgi:hypothetical protein
MYFLILCIQYDIDGLKFKYTTLFENALIMFLKNQDKNNPEKLFDL